MDIEVGDYVRTKTGNIGKIDKIDICPICKEKEYIYTQIINNLHFENPYHNKDIVKHSKNIIDLIEVGDYVNGEQVVGKDNNCILLLTDKGQTYLRNIFESKYIKSIVTNERMEQIEYKVEEQ